MAGQYVASLTPQAPPLLTQLCVLRPLIPQNAQALAAVTLGSNYLLFCYDDDNNLVLKQGQPGGPFTTTPVIFNSQNVTSGKTSCLAAFNNGNNGVSTCLFSPFQ